VCVCVCVCVLGNVHTAYVYYCAVDASSKEDLPIRDQMPFGFGWAAGRAGVGGSVQLPLSPRHSGHIDDWRRSFFDFEFAADLLLLSAGWLCGRPPTY